MIGKQTTLMLCVLGMAAWGGLAPFDAGATPNADTVMAETGLDRGLCVVLGWNNGEPALGLAETGAFLVHVLEPDTAVAAAARAVVDERGLGIDKIVVECAPLDALPHADNLIDIIVAGRGAGVSTDELLRVLRPGGKALTAREGKVGKWDVLTKPEPVGVDDWSHWEHGPDNNAVSTDTVIRAPYMTQWFGLPYYIAMPAITTAAGGRTFVAMGHIAHHVREEPWLNTILARNGYNGMELWRRRLPDGYLVHRSAFVATDDTFYMIQGDGRGCVMLDPQTGLEQGRIYLPETPGEWKWVALQDGVLYALIGRDPDAAETTVVRSQGSHWSWGELSRGYYEERVPWGFGDTILAYNLRRGKTAWTYESDALIDSRGMAMGGGKVYFYCPDARIGCLDAGKGKPVWANDDQRVRDLVEQAGRGLTSTPGFRSSCFCVYSPQALIYQAQTRQNVVALSPEDGRFLWQHEKTTNNPNALYLDGKIYIGIGPNGNTVEVDPVTGEILRDLDFAKQCCARLTATPDSMFCRGWPEGLQRYDRASGELFFNGALRPACNDGAIGANGLLYVGPWLCDCNLSLMGTQALCSAGDFSFQSEPIAGRLTRTDGPEVEPAASAASEKDWPAYRGGTDHGAGSSALLGGALAPLWTYASGTPFTPTAPVAAGKQIVFAGDDGNVRSLDAATGLPQWTLSTGAPVIQSPTLWNGRVYVGSGNGSVYCVDAASGRLLWRFRAAPVDRRIMVYGKLCSTWPVNTGVIVENGVAYAAAGIIDYDGTYVYALDAVTGEVKWENSTSGHLNQSMRKGVSAQGSLTIAGGTLWLSGGNVVSPAPFDLETGKYLGPIPESGGPAVMRGRELGVFRGQFFVRGGRLLYSALENVVSPGRFQIDRRMEDGLVFGTMNLSLGRIAPAWDNERLAFVPARGAPPACFDGSALAAYLGDPNATTVPGTLWSAKPVAGRDTVALAVAADAVVAAHATVQPYATLTPRWEVTALDRDTGAVVASQVLPGEALADGMAIDRRGRVLIALTDGRLACYGGQEVLEEFAASLVREADRNESNRDLAVRRLRDTLQTVHSEQGRDLLIATLAALGEDPFGPARAAGTITTWRLLGPVAWNTSNPVDKVCIGEPDVDITQAYTVDDQRLTWRRYTTIDPMGRVNLASIYGPHDWYAMYAYAEVTFPEDRDINLSIGTNDGFKCWFNGDEVGRFDAGRLYVPDQDVCPVHARKGINRILLKVTQEGGGWDLGVRLTDRSGNPIELPDIAPQ